MSEEKQKTENEFIEIKELESKYFFIPSYQRGYRWGDKEIEELLDDINDFMVGKDKKEIKENDFYCLQPIVVKKIEKENKSKYRVIDGQQRLTTIFLIIKYLKNEDYFIIEYETREKSFEFLKEIKDKEENSINNIDFYYFLNAYNRIKKFFQENQNIDKNNFYYTLINNCKVLWYEISKDEIEQDVFIRLNIGKIPLLEEENIKALFLSKTDGVNDLHYRARLWYENEKKLRADNDYSYLVLNKINREHIEKDTDKNYILNDDFLRIKVYLQAITDKAIKGNSKNELFNHFHVLKKDNKLNEEWDKLRKCMSSLEGFASNKGDDIQRDIFHYIGFLILNDITNINSIYKLLNKHNQQSDLFSKALLGEIKNHISSLINGKDLSTYINELDFAEEKNKKEIFKILVLFNIAILLKDKNSKNYFDFNLFQLEDWSLEHIYAQNSKSISSLLKKDNKDNKDDKENKKDDKKEKIINWLTEVNKYIEDKDLKRRIKEAIEKIEIKSSKNDYGFNKILNDNNLLDDIDENFESNDSLHDIGNLCLLDRDSNSSFGNEIFSIKKEKIDRLVNTKKFIPIATKQVFNKHFSKNNTNKDLFTEEDRNDYRDAIVEALKDYID